MEDEQFLEIPALWQQARLWSIPEISVQRSMSLGMTTLSMDISNEQLALLEWQEVQNRLLRALRQLADSHRNGFRDLSKWMRVGDGR